ncbi:MAG: hypothetical protein GY804_05895 [Alphaproteobacteria bacterium]|nr:hypothetical protein [Alphaproteobacteria bacterium]
MRIGNAGQSGRSMIEMLGVLAIVGVLSVGALAGYSMAMERYHANVAADNISRYIWDINELYEKSGTHDTSWITEDVLVKSGVLPLDLKNTFGGDLKIRHHLPSSSIMLRYGGITSSSMCKKIVLSGQLSEMFGGLEIIYGIDPVSTLMADPELTFPVTLAGASNVCGNAKNYPPNALVFVWSKGVESPMVILAAKNFVLNP